MTEYQDLFLKCDVLLLTHVFEKFRSTYSIYYGLELSWNAVLKMTDFEPEFISYVGMYQFIEKEVRGDVS